MNKQFRGLLSLLSTAPTLLWGQLVPIEELSPPLPASTKEVVVVSVTNGLQGSNAKKAMEIIEDIDPATTEAVIVQIHCLMDTNWDEINLVMGGLGRLPVRSYAFVDSMAVDAGALLAFAADEIYMAPASILGGSPILGSGNMKAKMESFNLATARAVALSKGRDPTVVEAVWNEDLEVRWGDWLLCEKGETLMVEAQDAVLEHEGELFLAEALVKDVYALRDHAGLKGNLRFANADDPQAFAKETALDRVKTREVPFTGKIVVVEIGLRDLVNAARFDYMRRILDRAAHEKASAVILDLNTPGGLAWHTGELMMRSLSKLEIPTYAYVNPSAVSAGALIALAADHVYMSPVSAIGAAAVVTPFGDLPADVEKKINSILVPLCRSVARSNGHDPIYATKFMVPERVGDASEENTEDGAILTVEEEEDGTFRLKKQDREAGSLLSLAGTEATQPWNGADPLAKGTATSIEDLIEQEGLEGEVIVAQPLGLEWIALWVTRFSAILLLLAFVLAQVEMRIPGFGIFGFLALAIFGLFFFGHYAAGKLAGFEMVALFLVGVALVVAELVFFPGTLVAGVLGVLCVLTALIYTMADAKVLPTGELSPWLIEWDSLGMSLWNLSLALGGAVIVAMLSARYLPDSRLFKRLILQTTSAPGGASLGGGGLSLATGQSTSDRESASAPSGDRPNEPAASSVSRLVGKQGVAVTALRPTGSTRIGDEMIDVVTDGQYLEAGSAVKVRLVEGSRIVVEPV